MLRLNNGSNVVHKVCASIQLDLPDEQIRKLLWGIKEWAHFWSPLHEVQMLYDDGVHQDFVLYVDWQNTLARVRTVRFCDANGDIHFFSPEPPPPTSRHHGTWQLSSKGDRSELTAIRWFELPKQDGEPPDSYQVRLQKFSCDFQQRLQSLLQRLGESCKK